VATGTDKVPFMVPAFFRSGKHHNTLRRTANFKVPAPLDLVFSSRSGAIDAPTSARSARASTPVIDNWGLDNWQIYPNSRCSSGACTGT
jgi:hypothetical protein